MRLRRLDQFHASMAYGDAISNDAFETQRLLWSWEVGSDIYAQEAKPQVRAFVQDFAALPGERREDAALLVRVSMGNESLDRVAELPVRKIVRYHNMTPARFFEGVSDANRHYAELGRKQLARLATVCELGIGDSEFNRRELEEVGFARTAVVPILIDWAQYQVEADAEVTRRLARDGTAILAVGQILPQKAVHDVIAAFARYRSADPAARLHLVGSTVMSGPYRKRLEADVERLGLRGHVAFAGSVPIEQLVAYYRGASVLLTLSDHEGFCVPLLEAMRFRLPIVAHAAGAIPETLGDAGVLLVDKDPDDVAAAIERVVRDQAFRNEVIARGQRRLADFGPEQVGERLRDALALGGLDLPRSHARTFVVLSSAQDDGIRPYARALCDGLRENGHEVSYLGIERADTRDLFRKIGHIPSSVAAVIVEHEFALFRDVPFVIALARLRRRGIRIILSLHELEPDKFHHYRMIQLALHYRQRYARALEVLRIPWVSAVLAWRFFKYRAVTYLMGALPTRLVVHSARSRFWIGLLTQDLSKVEEIPLVVRPLEGTSAPRDLAERRALRERLGLPVDAFIFSSPGYFFRRKRFHDVVAALPPDAILVLSGTESRWDEGYLDEVRAYARERGQENEVVISTEWSTMNDYVAASDCVVLYYEHIFQSGLATQAIWAGLPMIFSDLPGFRIYEGAGLFARNSAELREHMLEVQRPETYERLRRQVRLLRHQLSPERNAMRYLAGLELRGR